MTEPTRDLRTQLAQTFSKTATASGRRLGPLRLDLADAALAVIEDEGVERVADRLMADMRLRSMEIRGGTFDMDITEAREMAALYVGMARSMLGDAENYTETRVDFPKAKVEFTVKVAEEVESYVLTVQRAWKLTPHEARKRAEVERDMWKRAAEAEAQGGKARAEMLVRVEAVLLRIRALAAEQQYAIAESAMVDAADLLDAALNGTEAAGDG
jgi:hypothetical protein